MEVARGEPRDGQGVHRGIGGHHAGDRRSGAIEHLVGIAAQVVVHLDGHLPVGVPVARHGGDGGRHDLYQVVWRYVVRCRDGIATGHVVGDPEGIVPWRGQVEVGRVRHEALRGPTGQQFVGEVTGASGDGVSSRSRRWHR